MSFSAEHLLEHLAALPATRHYRIAYSGGCDSHVLLHAMHALRGQLSATLSAVHVHHGLSPHAGQWREHCRRICAQLDVPYTAIEVDAHPQPGQSPEAAAREARYSALRRQMQEGDVLLLAHHQDDQAETVLLQLLRGSGVKGLAAMPRVTEFGGGWLGRPLLDFSRASLQHYAEARALRWIDDPSNFDTEFDRNFLRQEVVPLLRSRWPALGLTLSRSAGHMAEAAALLGEMARLDLDGLVDQDGALDIARLRQLPVIRQRNLLRGWTAEQGITIPDSRHLARILDEVLPATADANPVVTWQGGEVRRYAGQLYAMSPQDNPLPFGPVSWDPEREAVFELHGLCLRAELRQGQGLSLRLIRQLGLTIGLRQGGETCRPVGRGAHRHELKKLFQEWRVAPWRRHAIPLIRVGDEIAQVVGHCYCEPYQAQADETGVVITNHTHKPV